MQGVNQQIQDRLLDQAGIDVDHQALWPGIETKLDATELSLGREEIHQLFEDRVQIDFFAAQLDLAGKAQIQLAVPARDAFRNVKLVLPLKKSLVAKRKALDTALALYKHALDYQVAEVTTAATFEMAELYRTLAKDIMASERPKNLSKDEREQYDALLEEQVYPFEEQAISLHEANAARAKDGLYDEWVKKSYAVLAELKPARYAKSELSQDVVTTLK